MVAKKVQTMDFRINFDVVDKAKKELDNYSKTLKEIQEMSAGRLGSKVANGLLGNVNKQIKELDILKKTLVSPKVSKSEKIKLIDVTAKDLANMKTMLKDASTFWNTEIKKSTEAQKKLDALLEKRKNLTSLKGKITKNNNKLSNAETALQELGYTEGTTTKDKAAIESKLKGLRKELDNTKEPEKIKNLEKEIELLEKISAEIQKIIDARKRSADLNKDMKALTAMEGVAGTTDPTAGTKRIDKEINAQLALTESNDLIDKITEKMIGLSDEAAKSSMNEEFGPKLRENIQLSYEEMERFEATAANIKQILASFGIGFSAYQIANYFKQLATEALNFYRRLDAALIEIRVVSNLTSETVAGLKNEFITMSKESGMAIDDITKAAVLFFQQGLNTEEVLEMTEVTAQFAKVAGVDATKAADQLTAAVNGYCLAAEDASLVADKFNKVAAASAADINELSTAFSKAAAQANQAGVSMDNYLAYIATMEEATREAPENIGTSLKTIFSRMQQVKKSGSTEDGETDVNQVETALRSVGVALRDSENQLRDLEDVLDELGQKWNTLDINTQAYLGTIIAGTRQQSRFITLMQNWDRVIQLSEESQNSAGQQALMHQKSMESLNTAIQQLSNAWETFISNLTESDAIKNIVKFLTKLINLINKGNAPIVILSATIAMLSKRLSGLGTAFLVGWDNIKKFWGSIKNLGNIKKVCANFELMGIKTQDAAKSQEVLSKALEDNQAEIDATAAEIVALTQKQDFNKEKLEELNQKQKDLVAQQGLLKEAYAASGMAATTAAQQYQQAAAIMQTTTQVATMLVGVFTTVITLFGWADDTAGQLTIGIVSLCGAVAIALVAWWIAVAAVKTGSKQMMKALLESGIGAIVVAIGLALSGLVTVISAVVNASENASKKMSEAIENIGDKLDDISSAATAIKQVERMIEKYEELSSKVYRTAAEQQELNDTIQALGDTYDIEVLTDKYGNLSISIAEVNEKLAEEREELAELNEELDKAEKDGAKDNKNQLLKYYDKLFSKNRSDYKKLLPGIEDTDINTDRLKASAQEIADIEINLKNAIMDSAEEQAYYLSKQGETISDYIVGLNEDLNEAMDDDAWEEYYTMLGEFGDQVDEISYADMQEKLDAFFTNFQKQCGLTTEQIQLLRNAMTDTLYQDSTLDETIQGLEDSIDKEKLLAEKQKEIDEEYKLRWYNWAATGIAQYLKTQGLLWTGRALEARHGVFGRTGQKAAAQVGAEYEINNMDTSDTEKLIASLERLTAASGTALDAIGAYKELLDEEGNVLLTAQQFLEGLNIDAINEAFKQNGNGAGYEEIIRQLARQIEHTDDEELKKALQDKLNKAVSKLEITAEFSWKNLGTELETVTNDLRSMNSIMEEFNENGGISLDTFLELCEILDKVDMESLFKTGLVEEYINLLDKLNLGFDESTGYITAEADSMETLQDIQQVLAKTQLLATIQKLENTKAGLQAELDMVAVEKNATKAAIEYLKTKGQGTVKLSEIETAASETYQEGMDAAMKKAADVYKAMTADSRTWAMATVQNAATVNEAINKAYTNDFSVDSLYKTLSNISSEMKWEGISGSGIYGISDGENVEVTAAIKQLEDYSTKLDNTSSDIEARIKKIDAMIIGLNRLVNSDLGKLGAEDKDDVEKYIGQLEEIYNLLRKIEGMENRLSHLEDYQDLSRGEVYAGYLKERIGLTGELTNHYKKLLAEQKHIEQVEQAAIKNSPVGDVFSFDEFGNIIIDYQKYINLSDEHKELADELYEEYQDIHETTVEYYEDLIKNINKALDAQQQLVDTYVDLEHDLADGVKEIYQDMLDTKLEAIDKEIDALDKLREAHDEVNQAKQDSEELSKLQTSLKRSMMDTSGASNTKVLDYQDQIQAKLEQMEEDEYTRRLDDIVSALEDEKEQLQRNFDEFFEDYEKLYDMIEKRILPNEEAVLEVLRTTDAYKQASDAERAQMEDEWRTNYATAMTALQDGGTIMDVVESIIELKNSITGIDELLQDENFKESVGTGFSKALIEWLERQKENGDKDGNKKGNSAISGNVTNDEKPKTSTDADIKYYDDIKDNKKNQDAIKSWWNELMESIANFFKVDVPNFFKYLPELIGKGLAAVANFIFDDVFNFLTKGLWEFLFVTVPKAITDAIKWCVDTFVAFIDWICSIPQKIADAFNAVVKWIGDAIEAVVKGIADFCQRVYDSFAANVSEEALKNFEKIQNFFTGIGQAIKDFFVGAAQWVVSQVQAMHDKAAEIAQKIVDKYNQFKEGMKAAFKAVADFFKEKIEDIDEWFTTVGETIKNVFKTAFEWVADKFSWVKDKFYEGVDVIKNFFLGLGDTIVSKITGAWQSIIDGAKSAWQGIKDVFGNIPQWFKDKFTEAWSKVKAVFSSGGQIFDGIKDGIASTFKTVVNHIISGINKVIKLPFDNINGLLNKIRNAEILGISPFKDLWKENPLSIPQIPQFLHGGMADFTGPAWLDGTQSAPEAVLNAAQTKAFMKLADNLDKFDTIGSQSTVLIESIEFKVDSMSSVQDGEKAFDAFVARFKEIGKQSGLSLNTVKLK